MENLKVTDLKKELKSRGLSGIGSKGELLARLQEAMANEKPALDDSVLDDDSSILDDDDDVLSDEDSGEEIVEATIKTGSPSPTRTLSPTKTGTVTSLAPEAGIGENGDADADDEALPPKKRKKIQINREAVPEESAQDASVTIPASTEGAAVPKAVVPEVAIKTRNHPPITPPVDPQKVAKQSADALAAEKAKLRQQKFGVITADAPSKPKSPAVAPGTILSEKAKKRLEKFGQDGTNAAPVVAPVGKVSLTPEDEARLTKRKERFGVIDMSDSKAPAAANGKQEKRAARFGGGTEISTPEMEAKKKARATRFGGGT